MADKTPSTPPAEPAPDAEPAAPVEPSTPEPTVDPPLDPAPALFVCPECFPYGPPEGALTWGCEHSA